MKASDIADRDMLEAVRRCSDGECSFASSVEALGYVFPVHGPKGHWSNWSDLSKLFPDAPVKVVQAKLAKLIRRDLIDGCPCGCRGDFEMKQKGRDFLANNTADMRTDK